MPSFKKINSEQNHKEETSQNNTAINKAGQKTIGRIKTGQNKAGRGISGKAVRKSGKAVPSSPEKKGVHGPSFFIPVLSAALAVLLFLAGSSLVLSRSRSVFEPGIQDPAGHSSTLNSSADSASPGSASPDSTSPGNTSPGSASSRRTSSDSASTESASAESSSPESLRSWLGVDTVLEILSPEPAEISQPSESQVNLRLFPAQRTPLLFLRFPPLRPIKPLVLLFHLYPLLPQHAQIPLPLPPIPGWKQLPLIKRPGKLPQEKRMPQQLTALQKRLLQKRPLRKRPLRKRLLQKRLPIKRLPIKQLLQKQLLQKQLPIKTAGIRIRMPAIKTAKMTKGILIPRFL